MQRALPHPFKHNDAVVPGPAERLGNVLSKPIYLLHAAPTATQVSARWGGGGVGAAHPCLLDVIYTKSSPFFFVPMLLAKQLWAVIYQTRAEAAFYSTCSMFGNHP